MSSPDFAAESTRDGTLPPWELAKAYAFSVVIDQMVEQMEETASVLLGMGKNDFICSKVHVKNGGSPTPRALQKALASCRDPTWYPGKRQGVSTGRPPVYSDHTKFKCAEVAMELKRKNVAPTPRRVRARLPNLTVNPETGGRMSDTTIQIIFSTLCYDEDEDDPWQYLPSISQDILPSELLPRRVQCAKQILQFMSSTTWFSHIGIDPCYTLLAKTTEKLVEQQVKAMGKNKWMSKGSRQTGNNPRAPSTTMTQGSASVRVDWTPVFARGKLRIVVVDKERAQRDAGYPEKLTDAKNLGKFIRNVLPSTLSEMGKAYGWPNLPRTVVHDKASYMVTHVHDRLNVHFAQALDDGGFTSWIGGNHETTSWLVPKWGDVHLHETVISHIRRLLDTDFACARLGETPSQFAKRMKKVESYMNSDAFAKADGGRGLMGLAKDLPARCQMVVDAKGARIPK